MSDRQKEIHDWLVLIDEQLAKQGVKLQQRPFLAVQKLINNGIARIEGEVIPTLETEHYVSPWFRYLYKEAEQWYTKRFGEAFKAQDAQGLLGFVVIKSTPFSIKVPDRRRYPGVLGETIWIGFPDHIEDDEDPLSWLLFPPNIASFNKAQRDNFERELRIVGNGLRSTEVSLMSVSDGTSSMGLRRGVVVHLEQAAELVTSQDHSSLLKSWWELQMAVESALKSLLQQKTGGFPEEHRLQALLNETTKLAFPFDSARFNCWPGFKEISDLRYGQGQRSDLNEIYSAYKLALDLCSAVGASMDRKYDIRNARFELRQPPWLKDSA